MSTEEIEAKLRKAPVLRRSTLRSTAAASGIAKLREALWGVSLRLIKPVTEEFGCHIVYIE